jgi:hypothetical protein
MSQSDPDPISCAAGCKRMVPDEDAAIAKGWSHLDISRRWRCPACWLELQAVNARKASPVTELNVPLPSGAAGFPTAGPGVLPTTPIR